MNDKIKKLINESVKSIKEELDENIVEEIGNVLLCEEIIDKECEENEYFEEEIFEMIIKELKKQL